MLLARNNYTSYSYAGDATSCSKKKLRANRSTVTKIKVILAVLVFFLCGLAFTAGGAVQALKSDKINELKEEIEELKIANERLLLEKSRLQSLDRIEQIAINELGMQKPRVENVKMVSGEQAEEIQEMLLTVRKGSVVDEKDKINTALNENRPNLIKSRPFVAAISNLISSWLITR